VTCQAVKLLAALACCAVSFAATTQTWEMNGYQDLLRGRIEGLSLTRDGRLIVGPKLDMVFTSDQPQIWSIAQAADGSLYLGTGNRGRLYKVDTTGKGSVVWTADQPEIFAVTVDANGVVYAGTSPDGKVYRIENGKATEYFAPGARYIWVLKTAPDGTLFVATGDQGKIFRVTSPGHGEVYYETGQSHVTCLALDNQGRLLAGSEPNGLLYRISAQNKAFVLYDASLPEIRAIVPGPDGSIYAAALGGSVAKRTAAAQAGAGSSTPMVTAPTMSITVTDAQAGLVPAPKAEAPKPVATAPAVVTTTGTADVAGVEKSALYKINADNTVETLWSSKEENAYDLVFSNGQITFITDAQGRIYRMDRDRKPALIAQANEGDATRLVESRAGLIAATGNLARILRLSTGPGSGGWFESPVHDAGTVAHWGRLSWRGDGASFRTRSGNSSRPDATWSDWSEPITDSARSNITSPNARYIQWRADLAGSAELDNVIVAYLPQNTPPVVRSISVTAISTGASKPASGASASYSITVTDSGDASASTGAQSQTLGRAAGQQIQISWQADDPDGDKLIYSLYFRGEDEREWKLLRANMTENTFLLDGDVFADGRYYFKVTASDRPANPSDLAKDADLVSAPVLIDNTPPVVTAAAPRRSGNTFEIDVDAEDRGSALRRCEFSIDAGAWSPVEASDGVTDSNRERFNIRLPNLPAGEHLVVIRVYDSAGNAGLAKVIVR